MANFFDGVWNALKHPFDEAQFLFDVGRGKIDLKDAPGEHQRMMNDITVPVFGDNALSKNSDAVAGAIVGSVLAAPAVMGAFGSGSSAAVGGSEFATGSFGSGGGKFGSIDFGGSSFPSFSGGAPTDTGSLNIPTGTTEVGGWKPTIKWGEVADANKPGMPWGDIAKSALDAMSKYKPSESSVRVDTHRPGFRGAQIPAQQFNQAQISNAMNASAFNTAAQAGGTGGEVSKDINALLGLV